MRGGGNGFESIFVKLATNCVSLSFFAGLVCIGVVGISLFLKKGVTGRYWALQRVKCWVFGVTKGVTAPKNRMGRKECGVRNAECGVRGQNDRWQMADGQFVIPAQHPNN
jgi:hypothetical protein